VSRYVRVAVLCDYPEEGWPSMDLTAAMILDRFGAEPDLGVSAACVCPPFRRRVSRLPIVGAGPSAWNADRLANRFGDYPAALRRAVRRGGFDLYHVVDHSYAQLLHGLPAGRSVVTCHDLDTFRCLLDPAAEPRPWWFRAMARRVRSGLGKAAAVACNSVATRDALLDAGLLPADRLHVVPMGARPECRPDPDPAADAEAARLLGPAGVAGPDLLHVGSTVPRKRFETALRVLAGVLADHPGARLVKVGGRPTPDHDRLARDLGVAGAVVVLPFLDPAVLAAVYRRADLVLIPSSAEGFGLPAAEALACGAPLLASDLPALREVAGDAATYRPAADPESWPAEALGRLDARRRGDPEEAARRALGLRRAALFSWSAHARRLARIYRKVLG